MRRTVVVAGLVALCGVACSSSGPSSTEATSMVPSTSQLTTSTVGQTTSPTTTVTSTTLSDEATTTMVPSASSTTTEPDATTTTVDVHYTLGDASTEVEPSILAGSDGANGTGCSPGSGPLPDGVWFGWVTWLDERSLGFDLGCLYTGSKAHEAAAARGIETYDWRFITNDSQAERTVPIHPETPVMEILLFSMPGGFHVGPYSDWPQSSRKSLCSPSLDYCSVWIAVNDGTITGIEIRVINGIFFG